MALIQEAKDIPTAQVLAEAKVPERLVFVNNKYFKKHKGVAI
jgi:hypothetical protein